MWEWIVNWVYGDLKADELSECFTGRAEEQIWDFDSAFKVATYFIEGRFFARVLPIKNRREVTFKKS